MSEFHAQEAARLVEVSGAIARDAHRAQAPDEVRWLADSGMKAAHVHAMLAVAEQQRIANLIAITDLRRNQVAGNQLIGSTQTIFDHPEDGQGIYEIKPEIADALGVAG